MVPIEVASRFALMDLEGVVSAFGAEGACFELDMSQGEGVSFQDTPWKVVHLDAQ